MEDARSLRGSCFRSCSTNSGGSSHAAAFVVVDEQALVVFDKEEVVVVIVVVEDIAAIVDNGVVVVAGKISNGFCSPSSYVTLSAADNVDAFVVDKVAEVIDEVSGQDVLLLPKKVGEEFC